VNWQVEPRFTSNNKNRKSSKTRCYVGSKVVEPGGPHGSTSPTFFWEGPGPPSFKFRIFLKQVTQFVLGQLLRQIVFVYDYEQLVTFMCSTQCSVW